jgi:hypothetical protein
MENSTGNSILKNGIEWDLNSESLALLPCTLSGAPRVLVKILGFELLLE